MTGESARCTYLRWEAQQMAVAPTRGQSGGAAMTVLLDTSTIPARDRADAIRDTVAQTFVRVELTFATDSGPAAAVGGITDFGQLTIFSVRSDQSVQAGSEAINPRRRRAVPRVKFIGLPGGIPRHP